MSDPIKALEDQISKLWKELTATQAVQPLPYLVNTLLPVQDGSMLIGTNQRAVTGLESGVKAVYIAGKINPDGTITNPQGTPATIVQLQSIPAVSGALSDINNDDPNTTINGVNVTAGIRRALDVVAFMAGLSTTTNVAAIPKLDNSQRLWVGIGGINQNLTLDSQSNVPVNPWFGNAWTTVSGEVTSPGAVSLIADTGALAAGNYDCIITLWTSDLIAVGARLIIQHRNAANGANINVIGGCGSNDSKYIFYFNYKLALNERIRIVNGAAGVANSVYGGSIAYRVTS